MTGQLRQDNAAQARIAREEGNTAHAEALYLEIGQPQAAMQMHQDTGNWKSALRLTEGHLPSTVTSLLSTGSHSLSRLGRYCMLTCLQVYHGVRNNDL
jgi:hypothetical protein